MKKLAIIIICLLISPQIVFAYDNSGAVFSFGDSDGKNIYLTFDDGYPYRNTRSILDILLHHEIPAAFFLTGDFIDTAESLVLRIDSEGHILGNHTWSHNNVNNMTNKMINREFNMFEKRYQEITNKPFIRYFRPPGGRATRSKLNYIESLGYITFFWSLNYPDWDRNNDKGEAYAFKYITERAKPGDIILMHTLTDGNVLALERIITNLVDRGFVFASLEQLVKERKTERSEPN